VGAQLRAIPPPGARRALRVRLTRPPARAAGDPRQPE